MNGYDMNCDFILSFMVKLNTIESYFAKKGFLMILVLGLCTVTLFFASNH
jgi:hypothetical protein